MDKKPVTRIDLERNGDLGVIITEWFEGWVEGQIPDTQHYEKETTILQSLMMLEREGYAVEMCDPFHGRALRGEVVRIDFINLGGSWHIRKYPRGWTARTRPMHDECQATGFDPEPAIAWCEQHSWNVRRWPGGARAFKGEPLPVRDASAIRSMRRAVDRNRANGRTDPRHQYDLMFDF
jgi:hypothetical protein